MLSVRANRRLRHGVLSKRASFHSGRWNFIIRSAMMERHFFFFFLVGKWTWWELRMNLEYTTTLYFSHNINFKNAYSMNSTEKNWNSLGLFYLSRHNKRLLPPSELKTKDYYILWSLEDILMWKIFSNEKQIQAFAENMRNLIQSVSKWSLISGSMSTLIWWIYNRQNI